MKKATLQQWLITYSYSSERTEIVTTLPDLGIDILGELRSLREEVNYLKQHNQQQSKQQMAAFETDFTCELARSLVNGTLSSSCISYTAPNQTSANIDFKEIIPMQHVKATLTIII